MLNHTPLLRHCNYLERLIMYKIDSIGNNHLNVAKQNCRAPVGLLRQQCDKLSDRALVLQGGNMLSREACNRRVRVVRLPRQPR